LSKPEMNKVVLIKSASVYSPGRVGSVSNTPPVGLAYIAAVLKEAGIPLQVIDAFGENPDQITNMQEFIVQGLTNEQVNARISADAEIIGFSCMFSNEWYYLKRLITLVKEHFPNAMTVLGGEHATALAEYCLLSCNSLDCVICGEGEYALLKLAQTFQRNNSVLGQIPGAVYRDTDESIKRASLPARIEHLDALPLPAWELFPITNYLERGLATITKKGQRVIPILASRGCPYSCKFCSKTMMYGTRYFIRSVESVIREIDWLLQKYQITGFELQDLTFVTKKSWIKDFCAKLIDRKLNLIWNVPTTRSESIDEDVVALLRQSGCTNLCLTPDSGSPRMIAKINKKVDLDRVFKTVKCLLKGKIILKVNLLIGFPEEKHADIWRSLWYGVKLAFQGVPSVLFYHFVPYPGSAYFTELLNKRKIPPLGEEFDRYLISNVYNELRVIKSYSDNISDRSLKIYLFTGYLTTQLVYFLFHPLEVYRMIGRIRKGIPQSQIEILVDSFYKSISVKRQV